MNGERDPNNAYIPEHTVREFSHFTLYKDTPKNPSNHLIPVLIVPGFASSAASFELLASTLNEHGFTTIRIEYNFGRPGEPRKWLMFPDVSKLKQQSIVAAIQSEGQSLTKEGPKQVIAVTHSKGALDVARVAIEYPEFFQDMTIFMDAPSNLCPRPSLVGAINKLRKSNHQDGLDKTRLATERGETVTELVQANNAFAHRYGGIHRLMDIASSAWGSAYGLLPKLKENRIGTVIIAHTEDAFNSPESFDPVRDRIDRIVTLPGIHGAIKFVQEASEMITELLEHHEAAA